MTGNDTQEPFAKPLRLLPAGAKIAGWDSHPLGKRRLCTAHTLCSLLLIAYMLCQDFLHFQLSNGCKYGK